MIRYATNPIAWSNDDDPSLGGSVPLSQCLEEAAAIGFDGIERGNKMPSDGVPLRNLLEQYGLVLASAWHSLNLLAPGATVESEKAAIDPHLDMLAGNGCSICIACETSNSVHGRNGIPINSRPRLDSDQWESFGAAVEEIASHCARRGLKMAYHPHAGTVVESEEEIDRFMESTGESVGLLLDTGHVLVGGGDPLALTRRHMSRLNHFHVKNVRPDVLRRMRERDLSFLDAVREGIFTVPGDSEGAIDFLPIIEALAEAGYDGWMVIEAEQDPEVRNPFEYQSLGLESLKSLAGRAGLGKRSGSGGGDGEGDES